MRNSNIIDINKLGKTYVNPDGSYVEVFKNFSMEVKNGDFVTIFGPNGCGKTTILYLIAGLIQPDNGTIDIKSRATNQKIGFVFQNYERSLFPWRTNLDNVAFPLELAGIPLKQRREQALQFLKEIGLDFPVNAYPYQLSGGQKQQVALARALINQPEILLMDEPFGSLDYQTTLWMHQKIQEIWQKFQCTIIFVSHDIDEAIFLASEMILLSSKPTRIKSITSIRFPHPRKPSVLGSEEFSKIKRDELKKFVDEIRI